MIFTWFIRGPSDGRIERRGGSGSGITTTRAESISYGTGPPASTETKWRGLGDEPKIAGSTGGFIGLISGIAIFLIISTFIGIYLWNRYRKRLPQKSRSQRQSGFHNPIPSFSFSRPSTSNDPYAQPEDEVDLDLDPGETPKASKFGFTRPVYSRQRSSEWEVPTETRRNPFEHPEERGWKDRVELPNEPSEAALPLRTKSPKPRSRSGSTSSNGSISITQAKGKGKDRVVNPFENPYNYDESRLSPSPDPYSARRQNSTSSIDSAEDDVPGKRRAKEGSNTPTGSGEESESSVRVSQIREGSRFVERFESKESLALSTERS
ncbi:hypothetical protein I302_102103 [Kwoniella bestiolae CBS 10118]|uniref:Uncharacterized protein n=1 Tax=Kwoniella bestiolae CBS 10118 TaxID=1296100 RepID=A0A1B9GEA2_9TREE|nr:hypothetical protein I302_00791 [Kwoniella bestiolae CBS 10118]OCF29291.1 hypothetical protein I302_00791 [Kwoniella bestiolae CBS 10118]